MKEVKLAIVGLGTVGSNVVRSIETKNNEYYSKTETKFKIIGISAKNKNKKRIIDITKFNWVKDPMDLAEPNRCDVLIELVGEEKGLSYNIIMKALKNKIHVITANKALLANYGNELFQIANLNNVQLLFEGAVGGGIPIINVLKNSIYLNKIKKISGILNGTTNFILSQMEYNNLNFEDALKIASQKGYAEADPKNDIEGLDSAYKITLLASLCYNIKINHNYSFALGINNIHKQDIKYSKTLGYKIKLISEAYLIENKIFINTLPKLVSKKNPLAHVEGVLNAIHVETDHLKTFFLEGEGAGGQATASSVIADLYEISKNIKNNSINKFFFNLIDVSCFKKENIKDPFYLRFQVKDQPGVLSKITSILTSKNISIQTILQLNEDKADNIVPIILTTYDTYEKDLISAIEDISKENFIENKIVKINIQN